MITQKLEIFADYNQVYFHDQLSEANFSDKWNNEELKNMAVVADGAIGMATARNMDVPVEVLVCEHETETSLDIDASDHAVSCGIEVRSGTLVIRGPSDYLPGAKRIRVNPGYYVVHILYKGLNTLSEDGLEGDDHYKIVLWPSETLEEFKLLKDSGFNN